MAKRQLRIHEPAKVVDKKLLIGELATCCINDNRVIFGTIIDYYDEKLILKDKLLKLHAFFIEEISEIIIEKDGTFKAGSI